jgi:hypothetical protein
MNHLLQSWCWLQRFMLTVFVIIATLKTAAAQPPLDGYTNFETFAAAVQELGKHELVSVSSLGKALEGRDLFLVRITRSADEKAKADEKPALLIVGSIYAPQLLGSELALRMAQRIVAQSNTEPVQKLLDRFVLYIIPRPNPDATETMFRPPYAERFLNSRPMDDDRDFKVNEDPNEDLNSDGVITMFRVEDATGKYTTQSTDNRVMIEADAKKNEAHRYLLYTEGRDNDHDEKWNEDGPGGIDTNRNFTFRYPYFGVGAGPHQVSELETRAIADFAFAHPNIAIVFSFSPEDNLLEPWKPGNDDDKIKTAVLTPDADRLNYLAEQYRKLHGGKDWPTAVKGEGSFAEWAYFHFGRWSLSTRGWWIPKVEPAKADTEKKDASEKKEAGEKKETPEQKPDERGASDLNALRWFAAQGISGFVPWTPIEHPDFPGKKVEVGGFKPLVRLNPPVAELDGLATKHTEFITKLSDWMPRLKLDEPKIESLGGGLFRVTAKAINTGYLPTMSAMGAVSQLPPKLQIKLSLPEGAKLLDGSPRVQLSPLAGNGGSVEQRWVVNLGDAKSTTATIRVWSASVGSDEKAIELK